MLGSGIELIENIYYEFYLSRVGCRTIKDSYVNLVIHLYHVPKVKINNKNKEIDKK